MLFINFKLFTDKYIYKLLFFSCCENYDQNPTFQQHQMATVQIDFQPIAIADNTQFTRSINNDNILLMLHDTLLCDSIHKHIANYYKNPTWIIIYKLLSLVFRSSAIYFVMLRKFISLPLKRRVRWTHVLCLCVNLTFGSHENI